MAFNGLQYRVAFNGSFNGNENLEEIPVGDLATGSRNVDIHNGGAEKRGGTQTVGSQITAGISSLGGGTLIKRSGTIHHYWAASNGNLYRDGTSIQSGRSTSAKTVFVPVDDKMFIMNGVDAVKVDTGSSIATIATPPADWTGSTHPKWAVLHAYGGSRRLFFGGVPTKENTIYYTVSGTFEDLTSSGSGTKVIDFPDGEGAVAGASKDGTFYIFGRTKTAILDDADTTHTNWGYQWASFTGGAHSHQLVCQAENFLFAMNTEGNIYEVASADAVRNVKEASITEPYFIHNYIKNELDLTKIDSFHMAYDPKIRAVRVFVVRQGETEVDVCLPFLVSQRKWVPPHDAIENEDGSGFHASASYEIQLSTGERKLYTQDYNGKTWELSSSTKTDDTNAYTAAIYTGWVVFEMPGIEKRLVYCNLNHRSRGDYAITVTVYVDETLQSNHVLDIGGGGATLGSFVLDSDSLSVVGVASSEFEVGEIGDKFRVSITNAGLGQDFFLSYILFFFVNRGAQRQ